MPILHVPWRAQEGKSRNRTKYFSWKNSSIIQSQQNHQWTQKTYLGCVGLRYFGSYHRLCRAGEVFWKFINKIRFTQRLQNRHVVQVTHCLGLTAFSRIILQLLGKEENFCSLQKNKLSYLHAMKQHEFRSTRNEENHFSIFRMSWLLCY